MKKQILVNNQWLKVIRETVRFPDGTFMKDFYTVERPTYAAVVPLFGNGEILLVRQYRHGPRRTILNLPMGRFAKKEKPMHAAKRELLEETGYTAKRISLLGAFENNPAFLRLTAHIFLARNLKKKINYKTDTKERTTMIRISLQQALNKILRGEIEDMTTVIGILLTYFRLEK